MSLQLFRIWQNFVIFIYISSWIYYGFCFGFKLQFKGNKNSFVLCTISCITVSADLIMLIVITFQAMTSFLIIYRYLKWTLQS